MKNSFIAFCIVILYLFAVVNGIGWCLHLKAYALLVSVVLLAAGSVPFVKKAWDTINGANKN